jgi:hypothetical protein
MGCHLSPRGARMPDRNRSKLHVSLAFISLQAQCCAGDAFCDLRLARNREAHFGPKENVLVR